MVYCLQLLLHVKMLSADCNKQSCGFIKAVLKGICKQFGLITVHAGSFSCNFVIS